MNAGLFSNPSLQRGTVGAAVVVALGLLAGFHSVVSGAVHRAAERRVAALTQPQVEASARTQRTAVALQAMPNTALQGAAFTPRTVSYRPTR